jgi:hypothetical protein
VERDLLSEDMLKNHCHQLARLLDGFAVYSEDNVAGFQPGGFGGAMGHNVRQDDA